MSQKNKSLGRVGMPFGERIAFTRTIHVMLKSGLPLTEALRTFEEQTQKKLRPLIHAIREAVEGGMPLSKVLAGYPKAFPEIYTRLIQAGEVSGRMEETLQQIVIQLRASLSLRNKVRNALAYPSVIVFAMLGIGTILVVVVLPRMVDLYTGSNFALPWPTRFIIALTGTLTNYWFILIPVVIVCIIGILLFRKTTPGQRFFSKLILRLPIARSVSTRLNNARLLRTFQGFMSTDVPIVQSVFLLATTTKNTEYQDALMNISQKLKEGENIAASFAQYKKLFPPLAIEMLSVGEQSGTLEENLDDLSTFYEEELELELSTITVLIEPILILLIGGAVGVVAFAVIWPMYSLVNQI